MFKIVQTRERNRTLLSIVPHLWEKDNKLYWPNAGEIKRREFEALMKDGHSSPLHHWKLYPCRKKKENLTYDQAVHMTKMMSDQSDTDECEAVPPKLNEKRKVAQRAHIGRPKVANFTNLVSISEYIRSFNLFVWFNRFEFRFTV